MALGMKDVSDELIELVPEDSKKNRKTDITERQELVIH